MSRDSTGVVTSNTGSRHATGISRNDLASAWNAITYSNKMSHLCFCFFCYQKYSACFLLDPIPVADRKYDVLVETH
mgnify:CR=1 FL=1